MIIDVWILNGAMYEEYEMYFSKCFQSQARNIWMEIRNAGSMAIRAAKRAKKTPLHVMPVFAPLHSQCL